MAYKAWMLAAIDEAGYNGIREEHIERVANALLQTGESVIDRDLFDRTCSRLGINSNNFTQEDLDRLEERLNRY